jgi:hypothetical protein
MKIRNSDKWLIIGIGGITLLTLSWMFRGTIKKTVVTGATAVKGFVTNLVNQAKEEWEFWRNGQAKEGDPSVMDRLRKYWQEGAGIQNWSDEKMKEEAWSAALVSYVMKKAGAGTDWKYAPSHSTYIIDSIKNRKQNNEKPFKGYRPEEVKVEVGDIIGKPRQDGVTYDTTGPYKSHADIVVDIKNGVADTIGGNVSNSVSLTKVPLTPDGRIDNSKVSGYKYFVVIKNGKR